MKKTFLFLALYFFLFCASSQTMITLIFQAKDSLTQNVLALDSVIVRNLTEDCDTTLYDSVSVLAINAIWPVNIEGPGSVSQGSFIVKQNVPNPFYGSTLVRIEMKQDAELNLALYDNQGRTLSLYHNNFKKGWHLFEISTSGANLLFLKVSDGPFSQSIKLLSTGAGNDGESISYKGTTDQEYQTKMGASSTGDAGYIFYLGNHLMYTAYVNGYDQSVLADNPTSDETYTFEMKRFSCGDVVNYSGKGYHTVLIGEQCWFVENLNAGTRITSTQVQADNGIIEKYCFSNLESNCDVYGGLYQWDETMQYTTTEGARGPCPYGWHIPSDAELTALTTYLGGESVAGGKMKEAGTSHWMPPNKGATNSSGFTGLPGGYSYSTYGHFGSLAYYGYFWSSSQSSPDNANCRILGYILESLLKEDASKADGHSIRCLKN